MQILFIILIIAFLLVSWIISSARDNVNTARQNKEKREKIKEKWIGRIIDKTQSLEKRNEDIITNHLKKISAGYHRSYYIENSVRDCIQDITEAEGDLEMSPEYAYLSNWSNKATPQYEELKNALLKRFRDRKEVLENQTKVKEENKTIQEYEKLKNKNAEIIKQFYEIVERKVSLVDDYGEENWDSLPKEIDNLIYKIAKKEGYTEEEFKQWKKYDWNIPDEYKKLSRYLDTSFKAYHKKEQGKPKAGVDVSGMKGVDFESHLVGILKENGFTEVRGTPATGDQGADLIAKKNGKTIIIQAKRYEGTVGNKAVQEVVSAVSFYNGDEGWVITNSTFTKSAKELAQKTKIKLVDGRDLARFSEIYGS